MHPGKRQHGHSAHAVLGLKRLLRRRMIFGMCLAAAIIILVAIALPFALSQKLLVQSYALTTGKVQNTVTIAHISDLHETPFGAGQGEIIRAVGDIRPDIVVMTGDMADGYRDETPFKELVRQLAARYPCYYVTGNHESWSGKTEEYIEYLRDSGVTVLRGERARVVAGSTEIDLFGVDDPVFSGTENWLRQVSACRDQVDEGVYSILLSHRPERVDDYSGFDLVLAGHAHGGQVRIPFVLNGLYAPNQGWFPKYAGGQYDIADGAMIVSRGLEINGLPRVFNRPEVVEIVISPA